MSISAKGNSPDCARGDVITHYTTTDGGYWHTVSKPTHYYEKLPQPVHSFKTRDGHRWDKLNGWTA